LQYTSKLLVSDTINHCFHHSHFPSGRFIYWLMSVITVCKLADPTINKAPCFID